MAIPKEPTTGIIPTILPHFAPVFPKRISAALEKEPRGPVFILLPKAISPITPVKPRSITNIKYGIRKAEPPNFPVL